MFQKILSNFIALIMSKWRIEKRGSFSTTYCNTVFHKSAKFRKTCTLENIKQMIESSGHYLGHGIMIH